jgi:hypothetical protein
LAVDKGHIEIILEFHPNEVKSGNNASPTEVAGSRMTGQDALRNEEASDRLAKFELQFSVLD